MKGVISRVAPNTYRIVAWFASLEEAMENSRRQVTTEMAARMAEQPTRGFAMHTSRAPRASEHIRVKDVISRSRGAALVFVYETVKEWVADHCTGRGWHSAGRLGWR